jgi:hypothetical protein
MKKSLVLFALLCCVNLIFAQKNIFLNLQPKFQNQDFQLLQNYTGNDGVVVELEHFNYYISDVKLFHDNGQITHLATDIWLVTPTNFALYLGYLNANQIDSIGFTVGVPKRYNTQAGALAQDISTYPETHPLSFQMPSMYWGWSFGYMHMIVGGKADSNNDNVPNSYFELHNLGNNNQQLVGMPVIQTNLGNQIDLHLNCHVDRWLNNITLASVGILHEETGLNMTVMQNVNTQNVFALDAEASIENIAQSQIKILNNNGLLQITGLEVNKPTHLEISDAQGKILLSKELQQAQFEMNSAAFPHGIYLLKISSSTGSQTQRLYF